MSNLLFDERPLIVQPKLAELIGLEKAVIVQQIHYWLQKKQNFKDGKYWVYNTLDNWHEQFRFIKSKNTLAKYLRELERDGYLITGNYNKIKFDRTKWYSLNYEALKVQYDAFTKKGSMEDSQIGTRKVSDLVDGTHPNWVNNTIDYTENTTDKEREQTEENKKSPLDIANENGLRIKSIFYPEFLELNGKLGDELTIEAIRQTVARLNYPSYAKLVDRIESYLANNIQTVEDARRFEEKQSQPKKQNWNQPKKSQNYGFGEDLFSKYD